jgi:hypothetical protein
VKSNITDNESAKIKSSHGVIQGYTGMAMVDDKTQVIIAAEAYGQGQEHDLLVPLMEQAGSNLKETGNRETMTGTTLIADTNYFSEDNCQYCDDEKLDAYIPDHHFRDRDPRFGADRQRHKPPHKNLFTQADFSYDKEGNCYFCPTENRLRYLGKACFHGNHGRRYVIAKAEKCTLCHLAPRCLKKGAKVRHLFITDIPRSKTCSERMMAKIDSSHGRDIYS